MEGNARSREEVRPQLLDLIPKDRKWLLSGENIKEQSHGSSDERKLELRLGLGPPGEEEGHWSHHHHHHHHDDQDDRRQRSPLLSLGYGFPSPAAKTTPFLKMAKEASSLSQPQNIISVAAEKKKASSAQEQQQQPSLPSSALANTAVTNNTTSQKRTAPASVVGWPPIRSFRKNLASTSNNGSSKTTSESQNSLLNHNNNKVISKNNTNNNNNNNPSEKGVEINSCGKKGLFVKINMDGVPIGRKVDLKAYDSYESLSSAVDELFRGLLAAQRDSCGSGIQKKPEEERAITGLLDGSGEYTLVYEDNEGDRMLVGDVPWNMFVSTVKRLRVLKSSDVSALSLVSSKQDQMRLDSSLK